jgi:hypothetical protein
MVQTDTLLDEALASQHRSARFDVNRGSSANAIEELVAVVDYLHAEFRQQLAIELASDLEPAHRRIT